MTASRSVLLALLVLGLGACGGAAQGLTGSQRVNPRYLFPLADGNTWTYDTEMNGTRGPPMDVRAIARSETVFEVVSGSTTDRYELRDEGVFMPYGQTWLLRRPLRVGENWPSRLGGLATVVDLHTTVETGLGSLTECVKVRETGPEAETTSVYCAGVGLALRETDETAPVERHVVERLRSRTSPSAATP